MIGRLLYEWLVWCEAHGGIGAVLWICSMTLLCMGLPLLVMLIVGIVT